MTPTTVFQGNSSMRDLSLPTQYDIAWPPTTSVVAILLEALSYSPTGNDYNGSHNFSIGDIGNGGRPLSLLYFAYRLSGFGNREANVTQTLFSWRLSGGWIGITRRVGSVNFQDIGQCRGNAVTALRYIGKVLRLHILLYFASHQNHTFQQEKAWPQTAGAIRNAYQNHFIRTIHRSTLSLDLNSIVYM